MVFDGEMRQTWRTLLTFTRPYLGTASSMSKTFAVSTYSGGVSRRSWMLRRPPFRSRLSCARAVRISLARLRASIRWSRERSGAATMGLVGVLVAGGMSGDSTSLRDGDKAQEQHLALPKPEVQRCGGHLTPRPAFAGISWTSYPGTADRPGRRALS